MPWPPSRDRVTTAGSGLKTRLNRNLAGLLGAEPPPDSSPAGNLLLITTICIVVLFVLIAESPEFGIIDRDSGVFLYIGDQILNGAVPYRDVWDHKGPVIFYIDAVGLFIGAGSVWGVWVLEFFSLLVAVLISIVLLRREFGLFPAIFASTSWLLALHFIIQGGNLTEEFALPLQFAALNFFIVSERRGSYAWRGFAIGLLFAIALLLRANLIGVWLFIFAYLIVSRIRTRRWRQLVNETGVMLSGTLAVFLVILAYFGSEGALGYFWDAAFRYNFEYLDTSLINQIYSPVRGARLTSDAALFPLASAGWIFASYYLLRRARQIRGAQPLLLAGLVGFPIEIFLASISGRSYPHYFMAWIPTMAILVGFLAWAIINHMASGEKAEPAATPQFPRVFLLAAMLFGMSLVPIEDIAENIAFNSSSQDRELHLRQVVARYLQDTTARDQYVLVWGAETVVNLMADRRSPSRFVYLYPLITPGYQDRKIVAEFLDDITTNTPAVVIDTSPSNHRIPPIDPVTRKGWIGSSEERRTIVAGMDPVFEHLSENYRSNGILLDRKWPVYAPAGIPPPVVEP